MSTPGSATRDDSPGSSDTAPAHLRLHSIDVFVRNQERSLRFYLDDLGFELAFHARLQAGRRLVGVAPPDGAAVLTLVQPEPDSAEAKLIGRATRVAFVTENVTAKFHEWGRRGVRFRHPPRLRRIQYRTHSHGPLNREGEPRPVWGEVFTRFEDPDRNSFALVSFDEVNQAIEEQRRANRAKADAERRLAYELDVARSVQARLFPQQRPACGSLEYAGVCAQARHVGGDYYDFFSLGPDRLGLVVGDVAGKGIAAALMMANLQAHLRGQCMTGMHAPEKALELVNRLFFDNTAEGSYATLFFAEYDDRLRRLRYVNCGHLAGLLVRREGVIERLESTGTVLGLFTEWESPHVECALAEGDLLVLYTDGVTESFNASDEEFGEARVLSALLRHRELDSQSLARSVLEEVQAWGSGEQQDDITLVVARAGAQR